ncbi:hypothetical protein ZEAMMB73_Zm00001d028530 [Zea mays]|uniref:Uncharacterized protein n=1 Tax=Zea mays TaxID=4577 RepID=A0A1D6JX35_MAIZE|nr:hypothetical protein ZEAMMB73_Zm00001d028530 [Zea mays]
MHPGAILDCCFHDDSSGFSAGADHTIRRLVLSSSKEDVLGRHDGPVRCVEYSYAADTFISMDLLLDFFSSVSFSSARYFCSLMQL